MLLDTSAAVAFVLPGHESHDVVVAAVLPEVKGLAGHAAFETYSVLTRLPPPYRLTAAQAVEVISMDFPASRFLDAADQARALGELERAGIAGGAVYDGLVALAGRAAGTTLVTCDRRAASTYRALGIAYRLVLGSTR